MHLFEIKVKICKHFFFSFLFGRLLLLLLLSFIIVVYIIHIWLVLLDTLNTHTSIHTHQHFKFTKISTHMQMIVNDLEIIKQPQNISREMWFQINMWFSCWMYFHLFLPPHDSFLHILLFQDTIHCFPIPFIYEVLKSKWVFSRWIESNCKSKKKKILSTI